MAALYGSRRDISLFRHLNRELMGNIITQQCSFYKIIVKKTKTNLYGEAANEKYYMGPILMDCLMSSPTKGFIENDPLIDFERDIVFKFLKDDFLSKLEDFNKKKYKPNCSPMDLYGAEFKVDVGDVIMFENKYYEVDNVIENQKFVGKDPNYPNEPNPRNPGLSKFGWDLSIICETHYTPADKVGISQERLI